MQSIYTDILKSIKTKKTSYDLNNVIDLLIDDSFVEDSKYKQDNDFQNIKSKLLTFVKSKNYQPLTESQQRKALLEIKKLLKDAKVLTIRTVFLPNEDFISEVYTWFYNQGFQNFLLDFELVPDICAGCQLIWEGKFIDLSLKNTVRKFVS